MMRITSLSLLTLMVAACSSTPPAPTTAPAPAPVVAPAPAVAPAPVAAPDVDRAAAAAAAPAPSAAATALAAHLDPNSAVSRQRSIYFDFDEFVIRSQDRATAELHGKYLASAADLKVVVEGNADERGSREYNLALGQKRAQAVVQALKVSGARDSQLEAISYGEEKPVATGKDESAYSQNRRADIRYK